MRATLAASSSRARTTLRTRLFPAVMARPGRVWQVRRRREGNRMEGYDVVTSDEQKVGQVVGTTPAFLIVERGAVFFRSRHPVPKEFAHADDERRRVTVTLSK